MGKNSLCCKIIKLIDCGCAIWGRSFRPRIVCQQRNFEWLHPCVRAGDVVGIAQDLGSVSTSASITYAIGYTRDAAVNYLGNARASYYSATYKDPISAVSHFLDDYADAAAEASSMDSNIDSKATSTAGTNYSDIVTLSVRQAYGAADLTIPADTLDTSDLMLFLKEISSDGNVNTGMYTDPLSMLDAYLDPL